VDCAAGFSAARAFPSDGFVVLDNVDDLDADGQLGLLAALKAAPGVVPVATAAGNVDTAVGFRRDLYYRLAGTSVCVPPLRKRQADVLPLARHFLAQWREQLGVPPLDSAVVPPGQPTWEPSARDVAALEAYHWPGNVRELENAVLCACALGTLRLRPRSTGTVGDLRAATAQFKRDYVRRALDETGWNQTRAAELLRIQRSYLSRLLNELELRRQ
jgi:Nif-specific regulatory protein